MTRRTRRPKLHTPEDQPDKQTFDSNHGVSEHQTKFESSDSTVTGQVNDSRNIQLRPHNWPEEITYIRCPTHSPHLTTHQLNTLHSKPSITDSLPKITLPLPLATQTAQRICIRPITDSAHPAAGQNGLFAQRDLQPDELVVAYLGLVTGDQCQQGQSDYDLRLFGSDCVSTLTPTSASTLTSALTSTSTSTSIVSGDGDRDEDVDEKCGVSVDALHEGNEARMVNDYRGVPTGRPTWKGKDGQAATKPNAEFRDVWFVYAREYYGEDGRGESHADGRGTDGKIDGAGVDGCHGVVSDVKRSRWRGERGLAIFVMPETKAGGNKRGIKAGEEVLVSYGKGFWNARTLDVESSGDVKIE